MVVDSSTIDVVTARAMAEAAAARGFAFLDAPVSGGSTGATAGTLTFMVGGTMEAFEAGGARAEGHGPQYRARGRGGGGAGGQGLQ